MPELYPEDQKRVQQYLSDPVHQVDRKPFNPWLILSGIFVLLVVFSGISAWIAIDHGVL